MYTNNLTSSLFSLAINRNTSGASGYLALGGTPPVNFVNHFASADILITNVLGYPKTYDFYMIEVGTLEVGNMSLDGGKYIVDSGTSLNKMPTKIADAINKQFSPPAVYNTNSGNYNVNCTAKAPNLSVTIGGTVFYINPIDIIVVSGTDANGNRKCISGVSDGGHNATEDLYILGDVFMKNVVSVFDIGESKMRFAAREFY